VLIRSENTISREGTTVVIASHYRLPERLTVAPDPEAANNCRLLAYELLRAADRADGTDGRDHG